MEFTTNTVGSTIFQSLLVGQEDAPDEFIIKMLTNNEIEGLLPLSVIQKNLDLDVRYNVTSLVPLSQLVQEPLTKKKVMNVFKSIVKAAKNAEEYMLGPESLVMDENHIYVNIVTGEASLMCLPIANPYQADVVSFIKKIMTGFQYEPGEDAGYILQFMNAFNSGSVQTVDDLADFIDKMEKNDKGAKAGNGKETASPSKPVVKPVASPVTPVAAVTPGVKPVTSTAQVTPPTPVSTPPAKSGFLFSGKSGEKVKPEKVKPEKVKPEKVKPEKVKPEKQKNKLFGGKNVKNDNQAVIPVRVPGSPAVTPGFAIPGQTPSYETPTPVANPTVPPAVPVTPTPVAATFNNDDLSGKPLSPMEEAGTPVRPQVNNLMRDYGNTIVMNQNNSNVTVMLDDLAVNPDGVVRASITRVSNKQKMYMDKNILKMGKESDYVDFYIGNNQTISRSHADIICQDGQYYVRDNNSKNHTYVNGQQIVPGQLVPIENNTEIKLSNETFLFQLS